MELIILKVHAGSKKSSIEKKRENSYEIWVRSKPERGLANIEALNLLADFLKINAQCLRLIRGVTTPNKLVQILGRNL